MDIKNNRRKIFAIVFIGMALFSFGYPILQISIATINWYGEYGFNDIKTNTNPKLYENAREWENNLELQKMCEKLPDNPAVIELLILEGNTYVYDWDNYLYLNKIPHLNEIEYTMPTEEGRPIYNNGDCTTMAILFGNILGVKGIPYTFLQLENYANFSSHVIVDYTGRQDAKKVTIEEGTKLAYGYRKTTEYIECNGEKYILKEDGYGDKQESLGSEIIEYTVEVNSEYINEQPISGVHKAKFIDIQAYLRLGILLLVIISLVSYTIANIDKIISRTKRIRIKIYLEE